MLIDTHAHLNFNAYKKDAGEVIGRSLDNNIWLINVGTNYETSKKAVEIAEKYPEGVYAVIGLHPIHLETGLVKIKNDKEEIEVKTREEHFDYERYKELAQSPKVVAIGETGLDYYWRPKTTKKKEIFKQRQRDLLLKQLELARELNLPVVFHCRMGHKDLIEILSTNVEVKPLPAVAHGFVGNLEELQKYLDFGFYIGFNGIIFKSIEGIDFEENIRNTPLDKILIETDCPYLTPPQVAEALPHLPLHLAPRGSVVEGRNEPIYVKYVAEKIAQIKNLSFQEIARITTENAKKLFNF